MSFLVAILTQNYNLIWAIRPRIHIAIDKMVDLKFIPFVIKPLTTILTSETPLLNERIGIALPIVRF
jgi:hypothetical protein